jgi:hypothetical protein
MQFGSIGVEQDFDAPDKVGDVDGERSCDRAAIKHPDCCAHI